jgi:hypothetical protein
MIVHGSLAYHKQRGYTLTIHCQEPNKPGENPCRHASQADWDQLIAAFGPDFCIPDNYDKFMSRLRCSACHSKKVGLILQPPDSSRLGDGKSHVW